MRLLALAVLCTGCQVVFPLHETTGDDDPLDPPQVTLGIPSPAIGGRMDQVKLHVTGSADDVVFFRVSSPDGGFTPTEADLFALDDNGMADHGVDWAIPAGPIHTAVSVDVAYDKDFTDPTNATEPDVHVVAVFGQFDEQPMVNAFKDALYAHKITTTASGPYRLGMVAMGAGKVRLGLYDDAGSGPGAKHGAEAVIDTTGRFDVMLGPDLPTGTYWIAWVFEQMTMVEATVGSSGGDGAFVNNVPFSTGLPGTFPARNNDPANYTAYLIIDPP